MTWPVSRWWGAEFAEPPLARTITWRDGSAAPLRSRFARARIALSARNALARNC
jgi:hypothetical protein